MAQDPLHLLCIESAFPGRLGAVADWLVRKRGYRCSFYCHTVDAAEHWPASAGKGMEVIRFDVGGVGKEGSVAWTRYLERSLCYAYGSWEVLEARRPQPLDIVLGHSAGLGSTLFAPVYAPRVPVVNLMSYYYHATTNDLAAEGAPADTPAEYYHWRRAANAIDLLDLENGVTPWAVTSWQRDLYPAEYHPDFLVINDGVDTRRFNRPLELKQCRIAGRTVAPETKLVTFVSRSLDRVRGFDRFVPLVNRLLQERSDVVVAVVGDKVALRGLDVLHFNTDYRAHVLAQTSLHDPDKVWFLDTVTNTVVANLLARSDLHVVPGRAYSAARSLVEAMASGCVILAWDTPPVHELLRHGETALITADDPENAARLALEILADPAGHRQLGVNAAAHAREHYDRDVTLSTLARHFDRLASGGR